MILVVSSILGAQLSVWPLGEAAVVGARQVERHGASCGFPGQDCRRLHIYGYEPTLLEAAVKDNEKQPQCMLELLARHTDLAGKRIAILGLAFKPGTDDVRNSRAIGVIEQVLERDAEVVAYDPVATKTMQDHFPATEITYADSAVAVLENADGTLVMTDWDAFAAFDTASDAMVTGTRTRWYVAVGTRRRGLSPVQYNPQAYWYGSV